MIGCTRTSGPLIIAHRGASEDAPENTLAAFRLAWAQDADGIEADFRLSADGRVVCLHDRTTERTTDVDVVCSETTAEHLTSLDVGGWKGARWHGERMPLLDDVLATVPAGGRVFIEIKSGSETAAPVQRVVAASGLAPEQITIIAFDSAVIAESRRLMPNIKANWLVDFQRADDGPWTPDVRQVVETALGCRASGVGFEAAVHIDATFIQALADADLEPHVWTVNDGDAALRFSELGVHSITTDRPAVVRRALARTPTLASH